MIEKLFATPWKLWNEVTRLCVYPCVRISFVFNRIPWGQRWRFYGVPIIQKHRQSRMRFGDGLSLRSSVRSNPLGPNHSVILCTWQAGAVLEIGNNFAMTGGTICAANHIKIGDRVTVGANVTIMDTDFHPLHPGERMNNPSEGKTSPVYIGDDVFIGMNCVILKGVRLGMGSVVGAGSVVTHDVPPGKIVAGNPARVVGEITP